MSKKPEESFVTEITPRSDFSKWYWTSCAARSSRTTRQSRAAGHPPWLPSWGRSAGPSIGNSRRRTRQRLLSLSFGSLLHKEAEHVRGFAPQAAVTHAGVRARGKLVVRRQAIIGTICISGYSRGGICRSDQPVGERRALGESDVPSCGRPSSSGRRAHRPRNARRGAETETLMILDLCASVAGG
jgi:hypothetical protein